MQYFALRQVGVKMQDLRFVRSSQIATKLQSREI